MDGTRIGDKLGLETCVVSQVMVDALARLPLEGCQDTRHVHGGKWRERVYEEVHPAWLTSSIRIAVSAEKGLLGCLYQFIDK